ncbi:QueT transporter family protein [Candidatus Oleimmundimicrobium sp.]|uniref:QueT transporter family protein n=1 Tax=Candidatus Oleimmundimicrobium sp. TaxID=3060597 RepID=UPI002726852C|nr:QueT transporter family protein [Candidatus Oleimmundimicrobium sp.]MDO8885870.1 QueT transporter family protein [Candidatus Oleimmundimicrobium sp.]
MKMKTHFITRAAVIAALYAALTIALTPLSYGQIQVRVSEALTVLAYFEPAAIIGLYLGCLIANMNSPLGLLDVFFGSFLTLAAASLTWAIGRLFLKSSQKTYIYKGSLLGLLPPVLINAFGVALILKIVLGLPYWITVFWVGIGEAIAVYTLGYPLLIILLKRKILSEEEN